MQSKSLTFKPVVTTVSLENTLRNFSNVFLLHGTLFPLEGRYMECLKGGYEEPKEKVTLKHYLEISSATFKI